MNSKTLIAAAVAGACAWPIAAAARISGPADTITTSAAPTATFSEAITPHSVSESAPWMTAEETRARHTKANYASMPNPQSPWSPNESGPANYAEDMRERVQHVASVEQARVAVARIESERLASIERERLANIERERLANIERERLASSAAASSEGGTVIAVAPVGGTSTIESAPAALSAESTSNFPTAPGERPAQPDHTAALVDTRSAGMTSLTPTPEIGSSDGASSASASETSTEPSAMAPVGVTPSEGASLSGTGPVTASELAASSTESTVSSAPLSSDPARSASVASTAAEIQIDAANAPGNSDAARANAYVTMHGSAVDATPR